ncbi:hypothetical protein ASA1KI_10230 [Opitutales bacterium ASA1]|nr:hypothetical protein ASA1KI_10230 [Opitutales bacterium ASA1]
MEQMRVLLAHRERALRYPKHRLLLALEPLDPAAEIRACSSIRERRNGLQLVQKRFVREYEKRLRARVTRLPQEIVERVRELLE